MARKILSVILALAICLSMMHIGIWAADSGEYPVMPLADGSGAPDDPYLIYTAQELYDYLGGGKTDNLDKCFKLMDNIDLSEYSSWTPIGEYYYPPFSGTFDGNGYTITVNFSSGSQYAGLFGYNTGKIKNLGVDGSVEGASTAGGIAGANAGTIENCYNSADITGPAAGGIAGENMQDGTIQYCYNTGDVTGTDYSGGIAGASLMAFVMYCHNVGVISVNNPDPLGASFYGSIIGYNLQSGVYNCYYNFDKTVKGVGIPDLSDVRSYDDDSFKSGEVAWNMQNDLGNQLVWGQQLKDLPKDQYPILTDDITKKVLKVTFTANGSDYSSGRYTTYTNQGGTVNLPTTKPTRTGYTFLYWTDDTSAKTEFTGIVSASATADVTITAVWQANYGGDDAIPAVETTYGTEKTVALSDYLKYQNSSSITGRFDYTIEGNEKLGAYIDNDILIIPATAAAGEYELTITAEEKEPLLSTYSLSYGTADYVILTITVKIEAANSTVDTPPSAKTDLTYTGEEQELVEAGSATGGKILYNLDKNGDYTENIPTGTDAGEYEVWYKVEGDENHNDTEPQKLNVTIAKAANSVTAPEINSDLTYNGEEQELVKAGSADFGELQYSLDENSGYTEDVPTGTNAGEYTVWYKVEGNNNYDGIEAQSVTITIAKAEPVVTAPKPNTLYYTGEPQELVAAGTTSGGELQYSTDNITYSPTIPTATNVDTYTVWYKVVGDSNYKDTEVKSVYVTIDKEEPVFTAPQAVNDLIYNGQEQELLIPGETDHGEILYSLDKDGEFTKDIPTAANAGTYEVWYKVVGDNNHGDVAAEEPIYVTISKAAREAPDVDIETETAESAITVTSPDNANGEYEFSINGGETWQSSGVFEGLDEDTEYTVEVRYKETDNYFASESTKENVRTEEKKSDTEPETTEPETTEPETTEPETTAPETTEPETTEPETTESETTEPENTEPVTTPQPGTAAPVTTPSAPSVTTAAPSTTTPPVTTSELSTTTPPATAEPDALVDPNAGNIIVDSNSGDNAPDVSIDSETVNRLKEEIIAQHLTVEEKAAVENGADLEIILFVEDAGNTVPPQDKQAAETVITDTPYAIGQYLNIDMLKLINGQQVGKITELGTPISVTIEVPETLRGENRAYAIVRVHDGAAEILEDQDNDQNTITILTDRFSTYAIVYHDTENTDDNNLNTGVVLLIAPFIAAAAGVIVSRKRKY